MPTQRVLTAYMRAVLQRGCVGLPMVGAVSSVGETAIDLSTASGTIAWLRTAPR